MKIVIYAEPGKAGYAVAKQVKDHIKKLDHVGVLEIRIFTTRRSAQWAAGITVGLAAMNWPKIVSETMAEAKARVG